MGRKKRKTFTGVAPQAEAETTPSHDAVEEVPKAVTPHETTPAELSPLTIALQKERGVYKKRRPYRNPQHQQG